MNKKCTRSIENASQPTGKNGDWLAISVTCRKFVPVPRFSPPNESPGPHLLTRTACALIMLISLVLVIAVPARADVTPAPPAAGPPGAAPALDSAAIENQRILESRPSQPNPSIELARPLDTLKVVASLAVIIVFVVAAVWALRRFAPGAVKMYSSENLKVISRTYIAPKQMVCLMKAPGKLLVVGSTQTSISLLSEITDPNQIELILGSAEAASARGASAAFRELLSGSARGRRGGRVAEEDLAAAVTSVSERFADLTSKLERPGKGGF